MGYLHCNIMIFKWKRAYQYDLQRGLNFHLYSRLRSCNASDEKMYTAESGIVDWPPYSIKQTLGRVFLNRPYVYLVAIECSDRRWIVVGGFCAVMGWGVGWVEHCEVEVSLTGIAIH